MPIGKYHIVVNVKGTPEAKAYYMGLLKGIFSTTKAEVCPECRHTIVVDPPIDASQIKGLAEKLKSCGDTVVLKSVREGLGKVTCSHFATRCPKGPQASLPPTRIGKREVQRG